MPKDYLDIEDEYQRFTQLSPETKLSISDFAKLADEHDPAGPQRQTAYHSSGVVRGAKMASGVLDEAFKLTGIPQIVGEGGEAVGGVLDRLIGTDKVAPALKSVGESSPRMFTEAALTGGESLIPKVLGYGASALGGTAQTDSLVGGAISAGTLGAMNKYLPKVGGAAERGLQDWLKGGVEEAALGSPQTLATTAEDAVAKAGGESLIQPKAWLPFAGRIAAETATGGVLGEAQRQADLSVGPNKVGITDPARNPFTPENIIGQAANALPMVGAQLLRRPAKLNTSAVTNLSDWLSQHETFVKQNYLKDPAAYEGEADPVEYQKEFGQQPTRPLPDDYWTQDYIRKQFDGKTLDEAIKPDPKDTGRYAQLFKIQLDNLDQARKEGRQDAVAEIENSLRDLKTNIGSQKELSGIQTSLQGLDSVARMAPPDSPKGFAKFIQDVNQSIDDLNENTIKLTDKEKRPDLIGESWHPQARSSEAVKQLGLLQPVTEQWLAKEYNATFDHSGNPEFAYRVVLQKVVNHVLNGVDEALQRRQEQSKAVTEVTKPALPTSQEAAIKALQVFPKDIRDALAERTVEMWSHPGRDSVLPTGKTKKFFPERGWNRALVQAAQTYDPQTGMVTINLGKKGPETFRLETLFAKDAKGNWSWEPPFKDLLMSEGRQREKEVSLEGMQEAGKQTQDVGEDEAAFHSAEQSEASDFLGKSDAGQQLGGLTGEAVNEGLQIPATETASQPSKFEDVAAKAGQSVDKLDDKALWGKVKDLYVRKSALGLPIHDPVVAKYNEFRQKNFKQAVKIALEDLANPNQPLSAEAKQFIETMRSERGITVQGGSERATLENMLRGFFGVPGAKDVLPGKVTGQSPLRQRLYQVLERVVGKDELDKLMGNEKPSTDASVAPDPSAGLGTAGDSTIFRSDLKGAAWPGQFANDVTRTFREIFKRRLSTDGYSGSLLDTYTEMATAIALTKKDAQVDFRKLSSPFSGVATTVGNRAMVGVQGPVNVKTNAIGFVNDTLRTLAHELVHVDQYILAGRIPRPDAMSDEEVRAVSNLHKLGDALTPEERASILKSLNDGIVPKEFQVKRLDEGTQLPYGSNKTTEFAAEVNAMVMQSLMGGGEKGVKAANEVLDFMPQEVIDYTRGKYRTVGNILSALKDTIKDPKYREFSEKEALPTYSHYLGEALDTAIQTARNMSKLREPDFVKSVVRQHLATLSPGAIEALNTPTDATWSYRPVHVDPNDDFRASVLPVENGHEAVKIARDTLFGDKTEKGTRPGWFSRFAYPFTNLMYKMERAGVPLARDVWKLSQDMHPAIGRFQSSMLESFLTRDKNGKLRPDDAGLLLTKLNQDRNGPWRQTFNQVRALQNENDSKSMFIQTDKGVQVDDAFKDDWAKMSRNLSPEDQQVVMNMSLAMDKTYQNAASHLVQGLTESVKNRTAALLMQMNKGMQYDQAQQMAGQLVADQQMGKVYSVKLTPEQAEQVGGLLGGADGLVETLKNVQEHLLSRPGYSSERLPGDWIIRFKTPEGDTKYLSARNQRHAELLAGRLQHEGNTLDGEIINKKDVDKYSGFDSPDDVLNKFVQVENKAWEGFLSRFAVKNGQAAADELRSNFVPGESSMKAMETKGLKGFLTERESKVDRSRFDYLEAMQEYTGKMATSLVYRSVRQQLNLMLSDPRAYKYPTFKKIVTDQFDHVMSPNPAGLAEMRSVITGYYLGANLSSAVIEGTQSATTLIPTLLRTAKGDMSPMKAYGITSQSIGDLFRFSTKKQDWQRLVKSTEVKDPSTWTQEESVAALYQKAVKDGIVELGVINDPDYGRDQRAIWTARFGHGDYGPESIGEIAKNKVYVATNQLMRLYSFASTQNNKLAVITGLRQGYEQGLRGDDLYRHAQLVKSLATFGGGKANSIGLATQFNSPLTRTAWGLASTLQQYGFGTIATYAELGREALGQAKGLSGLERRQAQKAFGTMLITQLAVGGAMSLPFAAAAIALLEKQFGIQAGAAVRQGLASLGGDDEELGSTIADLALSGAGNQLTGLDISSRAGMSNLFGTSAYNGFNASDMFGPVGGIVQNAVQALNMFGQQEPLKAAKALVPVAFKTPFDVLDSQSKYGDTAIRDQSGSLLYQPTQTQTALMMLGFRPKQVSEKRTAQRELALSQSVYSQGRGRVLDQAAQDLIGGNPATAQRYVMDQYASDPTTNRKELYRSILDRAADSQVEKDLTAGGSYGNSQNVRQIAGSFGPSVAPKRSEMDLLKMKLQLASQLGPEAMPDDSAFDRAAMMDALTQKGMTRAEASRLVEFLNSR